MVESANIYVQVTVWSVEGVQNEEAPGSGYQRVHANETRTQVIIGELGLSATAEGHNRKGATLGRLRQGSFKRWRWRWTLKNGSDFIGGDWNLEVVA